MKELAFIENELKKFNITDPAIAELANKYLPLKISGLADKEGYKKVNEARKIVKGYRIDVDKRRKELIAGALEFQRRINGEAKRITALLDPIESHLELEEKMIDDELERIKREKAQADAAKLQKRIEMLLFFDFHFNGLQYFSNYVDFKVTVKELQEFQDLTFENALFGIEIAHAKHKAEKERLDKERREEAQRLIQLRREQEMEQERLRDIAYEQEKKEKALKAEQARIEADKKAIEETERLNAERQRAKECHESNRNNAEIENEKISIAPIAPLETVIASINSEPFQPRTNEEKKAYKEGSKFAINLVLAALEQEQNSDEKETVTTYNLAINKIRDVIERGLIQNWIILNDN